METTLKIQKSWKMRDGFIALITGMFVIMFVYFNKDFHQHSKSIIKRIFSDIQMDLSKASNVSNNITKVKTTHSFSCEEEITIPTLVKKDDYWQPVDKDSSAFVFSAYYIHEKKKVVIIAIILEIRDGYTFCQLWYKGKNNKNIKSYQTNAKVIKLLEGHGHPYTAALFECPLHSRSPNTPPSYVSILDKNCTAPLNIMLAHHVTKPETVVRNFTVCLPMLHANPSIYKIVEWIEFNRILGAEHFFIYRYNSYSNLQKALEYYEKKGFLTVINWNLPKTKKEIEASKPISVHYFGQVASLNDCLYRNKYESEFIVNLDLDEFIIPRVENETTWHEMMSHVNQNEAAYLVRNTFFNMKWDNANLTMSNESLVEKFQLVTLQKLQHGKKIFLPGTRSKYFARTSRAHSLMIHAVSSIYNFPFPVNITLLHHYRDLETSDDLESGKVIDRTVPNKFGNDLIENVMVVWSELNKTLTDDM